jgi:hypothetical protein
VIDLLLAYRAQITPLKIRVFCIVVSSSYLAFSAWASTLISKLVSPSGPAKISH